MSDLDEGVFEVEKILKFRMKAVFDFYIYIFKREKSNISLNGKTTRMMTIPGKAKRISM